MPRPSLLNPLFRSVTALKGVGPRLAPLLARFLGQTEGQDALVLDLLLHMPSAAIDRRKQVPIAEAYFGDIVTLDIHIDRHLAPPRGKSATPHRVYAHDETGEVQLVFFRAEGGWVEKALPVGERRIVSGEIGFFQGTKQITHPDYIVEPDKRDTLPLVEPVYPLTQGLSSKPLIKLMQQALAALPDLPEWIGDTRRAMNGWPDFAAAMHAVHAPETPRDGDAGGPARCRLAYDEYLAGQLTLQLVRSSLVRARCKPRNLSGELTGRVEAALPFSLTEGQKQAFAEIAADLRGPDRMARLLQGDVGAGKTVVALLAMAAMAEDGAQSALMAPTELLAAQHFRTLLPLAEKAGLSLAFLTGKTQATERRAILAGLASGDLAMVCGTHALFQSDVEFKNLGLVVVDEQHRFGVHQRLALSDKGKAAELLVMTATPIPRTLILTHFGDMAVSLLKDKPAGRQPIDTAVLPDSEYDRVLARLRARVAEGVQAFWVCPLVEESEQSPLTAAEERFRALREVFGDRVELVHGRLSTAKKDAAMARFQSGEAQVLVATTVIEVGVDVPNATIMIVEHAERFGLAQLHQLRGRVGRGSARSACLLLFAEPLGQVARARLETIRSTEDGFVIAEKDLELRGEGDVLGTRQSGMPGYRLAIADIHRDLIEMAHDDASDAIARNPGLTGPEGEALRILLYLFRRDLAIPLIRAG